MNLIVAADANWAIGYENRLLVSIPSDMKYFRELTDGNVVVMGRKTFGTFPGAKADANRVNIVLTTREEFREKGTSAVHSVEELQEELKKYPDQDVFVIGGGKVYKELLPYCDTAYVTKIDEEYQADTWFPDLDKDPEWELTGESEEQTYFDVAYYFLRYERKNNN